MRTIFTFIILIFWFNTYGQPAAIYDAKADVSATISQGIKHAQEANKQIFLQIGGNWCPWCVKFHKLWNEDPEIKAAMDKNYITILVNYSKENHNLEAMKKLEYPQRFGFPVFVILDTNGKRLHTQNSAYLEEGDGYSKKKVLDFLNQWSSVALNPTRYREK